jgi:serine protease inhibitor
MKKLVGGIFLCMAAAVAFAGDLPQLAQADNGFAFDLFRQILQGRTNNVFVSPYSVSIALQMLCNGAAGKTRAEIQGALNTKDLPQDAIDGFIRELNGLLTSQSNVVLDLANSIWCNKGFELKPAFVATNEFFFNAKLSSVNFETPESADTINEWAADSTRGKITGIVSFPFPVHTEVVLANAIYFKGDWAEPFDTRLTHKRYFYLTGAMIKQAPMMSRRGKFRYEEGDGFQAVELPYAGDRLQMILILPATNSSPAKLLADMDATNWNGKILPRFVSREGTVVFPKFKISCSFLLNQPLQRLGMQGAFIPGTANFSGMSDDPVVVSEVLQKSYVDVNEQGTEAAAVTTVTVRATVVMRPLPPFEMVVDHPFFFVISDRPTGTILFMGVIKDPCEGGSAAP